MGFWGKLLDECSFDIVKGIVCIGFVFDYLCVCVEVGFGDLLGNGVIDDGVGWMCDKFFVYMVVLVFEVGLDLSLMVMFLFILFMFSNLDVL